MTAKQLRRLKLALADSAVEDIMSMSDAEILDELREEGLDPAQVAEDMRKAFERVFAQAKETTYD
jgi:hypothetical protein